jgi:hypothetical protein
VKFVKDERREERRDKETEEEIAAENDEGKKKEKIKKECLCLPKVENLLLEDARQG